LQKQKNTMKRREQMTFLERIYVYEVFRGVTLTFGIFFRNLLGHTLRALGFSTSVPPSVAILYPEERRVYPPRYRGRHRLTLKESGDVQCTACFLCATACPARCIHIEAAEHEDPTVEKFPSRYEIDTLLCIYCGYCVEACPVDAIRMDTGLHPEVYPPDPRLFIEDKETLMLRSVELEKLGAEAMFENHLKKMQAIEKGYEVANVAGLRK
jgi:NADH-quinone oxidoreductase subunit I